ncbi:arylsulfatase J-like [Tropilaelaps mercedesae]|uniref:Arylsulfatase J-like n=1 Tax=Tropilaelaps mercedesae TaxID=418985 RepID=A0A1V9Y095_9ACAR|nr:arylsulfatase J-like [Tropilaelaps mercedesae]
MPGAADMLRSSYSYSAPANESPRIKDERFNTGASNWALGGQKYTLWEGNSRVARGEPSELPKDLDGHGIWASISNKEASPPCDMLVNYNIGGKNFFAVMKVLKKSEMGLTKAKEAIAP